jgi:hypothetical protein
MANNNKITTSELDFDKIKDSLKTFMQGQSLFSDYDFEGSGLSILLDVLAYNTHYNALYTNLAVNESFLDSAVKRNSVVSLAKALGYTPRSSSSAKATVNVQVIAPTSSPDSILMSKYSPFTTSVDGITYTFFTNREYTAVRTTDDSTNYLFSNVELIEGAPLQYDYTVADGVRYLIPNTNCDTSTVTVKVQESSNSNIYTTFNLFSSIADVDPDTNAYFLKEIDDGMYEIVFGDGSIGRAVTPGNIVHIEYFVTSKGVVNGASSFTYGGTSLAGGTAVVTVLTSAAGGSDQESVSNIKFNAPKFYSARNRAVTTEDYQSLILAQLPETEFVSVWGGEDNVPPIYGKVFVCVKPKNVSKLNDAQKSYVVNTILSSKNMVSISPIMVDPEYIDIGLEVTVYYNESATTKNYNDIVGLVKSAITSYDSSYLQKFNGVLRYSKLTAVIDGADPSITNNITNVMIRRSIQPKFGVSAQYLINLINPIEQTKVPGAVVSSLFYLQNDSQAYYFRDDGLGNVQICYDNNEAKGIVVNSKTGTVDYAKGIINILNINIQSTPTGELTFTINPDSNDVVSALTQIARIDPDNLVINVISDKTSLGDLRGGYGYTFTSSSK